MAAIAEALGSRGAVKPPKEVAQGIAKAIIAAVPLGPEIAHRMGRRSTGRTGDFLRGAAMSDTGNPLAKDAW